MEFYSWTTDYDNYRRHHDKSIAYQTWFKKRFSEFAQHNVKPFRLVIEGDWIQEGRPYYNVHPQLVDKFARVNLGKIPAHLITPPHGLATTHVRFAQQHDALTFREDHPFTKDRYPGCKMLSKGNFVHGILMSDIRQSPEPVGLVWFVLDFHLWSDIETSTNLLGVFR